MSFKAILNLGDDKYIPVLECSYTFHQNVDPTGKPVSRIQGGIISFMVETTGETDLLAWMLGFDTAKSGTISFFRSDNESALKKLEFTDAVCINYQEDFTAAGKVPMHISMVISARKIVIGTAMHENLWELRQVE